jgi:hypothetical protein
VCTICTNGTYSPEDGYGKCLLCPANFYQAAEGQASCTPCPADKITAAEGAKSLAECFCPPDRFDPGVGTCLACGRCAINERVASACSRTADVICEPCQSCQDKQQYVVPSTMCNGYGQTAVQQCRTCR